MMNTKGQGLSINTIIIAIIVLVVLVVLIMVFTGYFASFSENIAGQDLQQCKAIQDASEKPQCAAGEFIVAAEVTTPGWVCCKAPTST